MKKILALLLMAVIMLFPIISYASQGNSEEQAIAQLVAEVSLTDKWKAQDIHLLAQVIYGEARGEAYTGKVAVAAVVLNRIESPLFPNTLKEVVFQPNAFTCVDDGQIHLKPDYEAYKAATDAILGNDPTNGCLYYMNPKTATSRWMHKRISAAEAAQTIGNHVFVR